MLYLYQSDRLESLCELLAAVVQQPQEAVLAPETVIVQSKGMGRWITLQLAQKHGVCANIEFPLPASFVWQLARQVVGNLPEQSPFSPELMSWRLLTVLEQLSTEQYPETAVLARYLEGGNAARHYRLAWRIADLLDQYLVYRPEWIAAWEQQQLVGLGPDEHWQATLWRLLSANRNEPHRAEVIQNLLDRLNNPDEIIDLPERVVLFAVSSLPPVLMALIEALSSRMDVCLFALNPCEAEWGQITDRREQQRLSRDATEDDDLFLEIGNPLLASLGKQGRDFFDEIHARFPELVSLFEEPEMPPQTLLEVLQRDILSLQDRQELGPEILPWPDRSLQIHACHSPMRELEVLHDQLLALFDESPDLQPDEVVVLIPAIADYAPYIDAVFAPREGEPAIPYSIADRGLAEQHPLLDVYQTLMTLPESRFEAEWVMGILDHPAVLRRFELSAEDLPMIRQWLQQARVHWGRDGQQKAGMGLPQSGQHTWQHSLSRLLLGYALPVGLAGEQPPLFADLLPCDVVEGSSAECLGSLVEFVDRLDSWAHRLAQPCKLTQWNERLNQLLSDFFEPDSTEEEVLLHLRGDLEILLNVESAGYCQLPVDFTIISAWLVDLLKRPAGSGGFLSGGVTFCNLVPMRSLPFRVICLLGLNDGDFPRVEAPAGFDLIARHPRRGDRSRRFDDRYLFLETLLSAREVLYLSYVGQNIRDNSELPPSVLLADLIEVAEQTVDFQQEQPVSKLIVTEHALQPFNARYFCDDPRYPGFSNGWLQATRALAEPPEPLQPLLQQPLTASPSATLQVDVEDFLRFFTNPVRYFLRERLGIRLDQNDLMLANEELFSLNDQFLLRQQIHQQLLSNHQHWDREQQLAVLQAAGELPPGGIGDANYRNAEMTLAAALPRLAPLLEEPVLPPLEIEFSANGVLLSGWLRDVRPGGLIEVETRAGESSPRSQLLLWLRHVLLCLAAPAGVTLNSQLHTLDKSLSFDQVEDPVGLLERYLDLFRSAQQGVPPFFCKSALAYAESWRKDQLPEKALKQARGKWDIPEYRNGNFIAESENPYYQLFYRGSDPLADPAFAELALAVYQPMLDALSGGEQ